uniref:Heavy metal transport/detoxification superfamily protein n=1 Tax=Zea mays TaxID=4577 RepID=A0A804QGY8_MAIZE
MADKISTIVLKVDLECERCYRKIRKVLCKIQDKMNIKTISFDEKSNAVTISGPFDADTVCNKLCCKAGRVIKAMDVKGKDKDGGKAGKEGGGDKPKDAGKPAAAEKKKEEKADKKEGGKGDKEAKPAEKGNKDGKAEAKKVKFAEVPAADAKPGKAMPPGMTKADLGPLLEKMMAAKAGSEPQPIAPPPGAAQGVAVPSVWPAPAGSVSGYGYGYNPGYNGYCRCGKPAAPGPGGYYGVPVYDSQGWYYGGGGGARQPYYPQQHCCEDPNAGCSVM